MDVLRDNPELRPFVLSNVRFTGTAIGAGAYGKVDEVEIPVGAAAKTIYGVLHGNAGPRDAVPKAVTEFVRECQLMSTLRHPNIVQFLGVCFFPGSRLPALVMERLLTSLHDLLDPEIRPPPGAPTPLSFFTLSLKCCVLHDVASGLAYLHKQSPPIIHRDLSARNVLLNSGMVAKIADLGVARIVPGVRAAATMTKAPGASVYMPPEAVAPSASNAEMSKYNDSIDIFSFGVVTIFTIGETFPCDPLAPNYLDESSGLLVARTELQRRSGYMRNVNIKLRACDQLRGDHPIIRLIQQCLHNGPHKRPNIHEVMRLLDEARTGIRDEESERNRQELVRTLQTQPRNQNLERVVQDLVTENAVLQSRVQEVTELQQQLQSSEREKQTIRQQLKRAEETIGSSREHQLTLEWREQLSRAEETIRREQQQTQEWRQQMSRAEETIRREQQQSQQKDRELAQAQQRLREKEEQLESSEALVAEFQKSLQQKDLELESLRAKGSVVPPQTSTSSASQPAHQVHQPILRAVPHSFPTLKPRKLNVKCHRKKTAPRGMYSGSATTDHQFSYFTPLDSNSVYSYQWCTDKWEELPRCPNKYAGLVIINGQLTTVGGRDGSRYTNTLFTLRQRQWIMEYPPMNAARSRTTIVSSSDGEYIIVIGGWAGDWTATVELFQVSSRRWHQLKDLPQPLPDPSATVCGNQLHVIGIDSNGYLCSLQALLSSDRAMTSQSIPQLISWTSLPRLPVTHSTAATLSGQLVIIGGGDWPLVKTIHQLFNGQWVKIGSMSCGRRSCLVVSPSSGKMMIVGGKKDAFEELDIVEECVVV